MRTNPSRPSPASAILAIVTLLMGGCAARQAGPSDPTRQEFDYSVLTQMNDHLMHDLRIASACKGKRIRAELSSFCVDLHADQTREQERIERMLKDWYGKNTYSDPYPLWIESQDGDVFEKEFLKGVLKDHREVAERARKCTVSAKRDELRIFCREVNQHRMAEAVKMEKWSCEWFKEC